VLSLLTESYICCIFLLLVPRTYVWLCTITDARLSELCAVERPNSRGGGNNVHSLTQNLQTSAERCTADASSVRCCLRYVPLYVGSATTTSKPDVANISTVIIRFMPYVHYQPSQDVYRPTQASLTSTSPTLRL